ncbi:NAD(P)H-dependent oxidoreductase [Antiquaquibacter oligotrophicus]|nr:NAD(P)H-dependent oxidoreductase [Antiquaquibacter oligotrophicus]UDF14684.1 NAD(P)H-dependent oxidoreductase [Antiquaquibacter oligotrophicus]
MPRDISVLALVCTLTPSPELSSTQLLADQVLASFRELGVLGQSVRTVDMNVSPGVTANEGDGDGWPRIRSLIMAADILLVATPIWMGHASSEAYRAMERLDAELSTFDDEGRAILAGKVATVAVVGNEDGAHKATADLYQGLNDVGFTIPSQGGTYWVGQAMQTVDYKDLDSIPDEVANANLLLATNATHLASVLREKPYLPTRP